MHLNKNIPKKFIWIYVTDIETILQMKIVAKTLNAERSILQWSVDTEDIDNVLRVESKSLGERHIQQTLENKGLICTPMID